MKLEDAIEYLEYHEPGLTHDQDPKLRLSLKLGIEAMKRLLKIRRNYLSGDFYPLPGETKD